MHGYGLQAAAGLLGGEGFRVEGFHEGLEFRVCRGTSRIRNSADLGPYSRAVPRALWWS